MVEVKPYRHLFFDLDHTLWDFETNSSATLIELIDQYELKTSYHFSNREFLETYFEINENKWDLYRNGKITKERLRKERFLETFSKFGLTDEAFSRKFEREYINKCPHKKELLPYTLQTLDYLVDKYELHIITNGFSEVQELKLSGSGLKPYFQKVITSDEVGVNKPGAGIFAESLKRTGAKKEQALMIGDNLNADILGAKKIGMDQVYFNPEGQEHQEDLTFEIRSLKELTNIL